MAKTVLYLDVEVSLGEDGKSFVFAGDNEATWAKAVQLTHDHEAQLRLLKELMEEPRE